MIGTPPALGASAAFCARVPSPSAGRGLASVVSIPSERRETGTECKRSFRRPLSYRLYPQDAGSTTAPVLLRALGVAGVFGGRRGGRWRGPDGLCGTISNPLLDPFGWLGPRVDRFYSVWEAGNGY